MPFEHAMDAMQVVQIATTAGHSSHLLGMREGLGGSYVLTFSEVVRVLRY